MSRAFLVLALVLAAGPVRATCWEGGFPGSCDSYHENQRQRMQYQLQRQREAIHQLQQQQQQGGYQPVFPGSFGSY